MDPLSQEDIARQDRSEVNAFDRSATCNWSPESARWSDRLRTTLVISPALLMLDTQMRSDFLIIAVMYAESILIEEGLTGIVKNTTGRKRPFVYNPDVPDSRKTEESAVRSFYSGHASTAFNSAIFFCTVFSDYYPDSRLRWAVWVGMLATASMVGYLRYRAGMHYPTDVIAGAVMGSLSGFTVPFLHRQHNTHITILPYTGEQTGISISFRL